MNQHRVSLSLGLLLILLLSACQTPPKPAFRDVPVYPSAQQVDGTQDAEWRRTISFRTSDPQEAVLTYYKNTLPQQGWIFEGESFGNLGFYYPDTDERQPLINRLRILTSYGEHTDFAIDQLIVDKRLRLTISP